MIRQNLHTHTVFDDGRNTPDEMAEAALAAGLTSLGFSVHSVLPYENDWSISGDRLPAYLAAVAAVRVRFRGRLTVYSGIEWDGISTQPVEGFDYVIGSLHHIAADGAFPSIDDTPDVTRDILERYFSGNQDDLAEAYYAQYAALAASDAVDIVGHFDLITKFSEKTGLLPGDTPRCRDCAMAALETLLKAEKLFEVNTGAMAKGWRTAPYPSPWLLRELCVRGGRVILSSDAHSADTVAFAFPETEALLRRIGFRERWELTETGFVSVPL